MENKFLMDKLLVLVKTLTSNNILIDPSNGFNRVTRTFHSLKPPLRLPPPNATISAPSYVIFLRRNSPWSDSVTALIDSATGRHLSYINFIHCSETLVANRTSLFTISKNDTALVLSPNLSPRSYPPLHAPLPRRRCFTGKSTCHALRSHAHHPP
ncbi:4-coumarate--CoA ligase-like [Arachis hypogaea]|uniref:4-coumarate--CoA ligase-like n=1 Tax=Arachis hypogaea TaxID=3818 RepID=A0A6B9V623_ARAHY|nr:4-coumarate--CoA ligase-like [Arachis hypogaea]